MKRSKSIFLAATAALILCAGCTSKPTDSDVADVLTANIPKAFMAVVAVEQIQADISGGDEAVVKFKSHLKLSQPLFETVAFGSVAAATGSDVTLFKQIKDAAQGLTSPAKEELAEVIKKAITKPAFISLKTPIGATVDWYGSFKEKKVVDKWVSSDFKTEVEPAFKGQPRDAFDAAAIEDSKAKDWFVEVKTQQIDVLQKIENSKKLAQKDIEIQQAKAQAQHEREAKEALIAAKEKQARQLPVSLSVRPSVMGNTLVLVMQATQAMTVHLEVARGLQRFAHDYQLLGGKPMQVGHMEGWGFAHGDVVRLTNSAFDPKVVAVP